MEISSLKFILSSKDGNEMAPFIGSTIRGAFGNILKDLYCVEPLGKCSVCMLRSNCIYTYLFESGWYFSTGEKQGPGVPQPYVFEPQIRLENNLETEIELGLLLFGAGIKHLPVFIFAIKQIEKWGLGRERIPFRLEKVEDRFGEKLLWNKNRVNMVERPTSKTWDNYLQEAFLLKDTKRCQIKLTTPLRMKEEGKLNEELKFRTIINAVVRRWNALNKYYGNGQNRDERELIKLAESIPSGTLDLRWEDMERYSRRQDRRMMLGGLMGIMECAGELEPFMPWLLLGQDIHIGKNTSFGLGKYELLIL